MPALTHALMEVLLWTLIHSLWIGALAAGAARALLLVTRRSPAAVRYRCILAAGVLFLGGTAWALCGQLEGAAAARGGGALTAASGSGGAPGAASLHASWWSAAEGWLNAQAPFLLGAWLLIAFLRLLQLGAGLRSVHGLRTRGLGTVGAEWTERLAQLARGLGLQRVPRLRTSVRVSMPVVVGHFKPLLLVPVGWLTSLPPEDVEAILLHELAHLRRGDYLVNGVQYFFEALFFFNPGFLFISRSLREEREHCCDEAALAQGADRRAYVEALLQFSTAALQPRPAAALTGGSSLKDRVQRILFHQPKNITPMQKLSVAAALLATVVTVYAFGQPKVPAKPAAPPAPPAARSVEAPPAPPAEPALPALPGLVAPPAAPAPPAEPARIAPPPPVDTPDKDLPYTFQFNDKVYKLRLEGDKITELYVDGERIPENRFSEFASLLEKLKEHQKLAAQHKELAVRHAEQAEVHAARMKEHAVQMERHQATQAEHARTVRQHAEVARQHEAIAREHQKTARKHEERARVHKGVLDQLAEEGLIKKGYSRMMKKDGKMWVDGVLMSDEAMKRYHTLLNAELKERGVWQ